MPFDCSLPYNLRPFVPQFIGTHWTSAIELHNCHPVSAFVGNIMIALILLILLALYVQLLYVRGWPKQIVTIQHVLIGVGPFVTTASFMAVIVNNFSVSSDGFYETAKNSLVCYFLLFLSSVGVLAVNLNLLFHVMKNTILAFCHDSSYFIGLLDLWHRMLMIVYVFSGFASFALIMIYDDASMQLIYVICALVVTLYVGSVLLCAVIYLRFTLLNLNNDLGLPRSKKFDTFFVFSILMAALCAAACCFLAFFISILFANGHTSFIHSVYYDFGRFEIMPLFFAVVSAVAYRYVSLCPTDCELEINFGQNRPSVDHTKFTSSSKHGSIELSLPIRAHKRVGSVRSPIRRLSTKNLDSMKLTIPPNSSVNFASHLSSPSAFESSQQSSETHSSDFVAQSIAILN